MRLSEDKISHVSHLLREGLTTYNLAEIKDSSALLKLTKKIITQYCELDDEVDEIVRKKIQSYSRSIQEGSREWEVMYKKHFEEEMAKKW